MAERKAGGKERVYEVAVSFDGLNKGERFSQVSSDTAWADQHVETGYLVDVTGEPTAAEAQGAQAPRASDEAVQEAQHGGQERQG